MKTVLGLDLGTNSIGWALINEANNNQSEIIKLGVRVNPLTIDEKTNFEKGRPLSTNADRTLKRGARRNLQRYKLRREKLIETLIGKDIISNESTLAETGKNTTHQTLQLRAKASKEEIGLEDFTRVLLSINKKRGYKSSRKSVSEEDGMAIDGMAVAKELYDNKLTPGQYVYRSLNKGKNFIPDFYKSDLQKEFDNIWNYQKQFHAEILTDEMYVKLKGQGLQNSRKLFLAIHDVYTAENKGKRNEINIQHYTWRNNALSEVLEISVLAYVLVYINNDLNKSSGYLGAISDRSKSLYMNKQTVGEFLYQQIHKNPHTRLKNQVFYRQDYLDEFEKIWETQAKSHPKLTDDLKEEIRDIIIFYQRKLKSQKGLLSFCLFESKEQSYIDSNTNSEKTRTIGRRVIPKSSPLFQEFKIWQQINNLEYKNNTTKEKIIVSELDDEIRKLVFEELNLRGNSTPKEVLKVISTHIKIEKISQWKCNYEKVEGNTSNQIIYNIYQKIAESEGYGFDWSKKTAQEIKHELSIILPEIGIDSAILHFDSNIEGKAFDKQKAYQLWHLLYAAEDDEKIDDSERFLYGNSNVKLKKVLHKNYGFKPEYANLLANISLQADYSSLSTKAIRKIIPFLEAGNSYSESCALAGYNHSNSLTKEEQNKRELKDRLSPLKKNSLRNPVVEKILNQMVNLINEVSNTYGKPDEVRIELARELKKSASERSNMTKSINDATRKNEDNKKLIKKKFGFTPTRNDVIRYKLWQELESRAYKSLFCDRKINKEDLFSKKIDIEHIIPKALLFDDSFSNKTLAYREINLKKANRTALDFISQDHSLELNSYRARVEDLFKIGAITKGKYKKLLMSADKLPEGFIERDLRNSQYIAKKAKSMLEEVFRTVTPTSGRITDKLREDWGLINIMKELNLPKYSRLGLTEIEKRKNNKEIEIITDWTKRNDHRHHAMDALTVAFTTHDHIQYLNNLNSHYHLEKNHTDHDKSNLHGIQAKILDNSSNNSSRSKGKFKAPMNNFREVAKKEIESILISFKTKNKVVTRNVNKTKLKQKGKYNTKTQLTPRGQLHKETIYGKSKQMMNKPTKLNKKFSATQAKLIVNNEQKAIILSRIAKYENNPNLAFDSKTLKKDPILYKKVELKEVVCYEEVFTIRKDVSPDLKIDKVIDKKIQEVLHERLNSYDNDPKKAFSDLDKHPIWLDEKKSIAIKRVTIKGVSNAEALHVKKDHLGNNIIDDKGKEIPTDYVSTGNNHHVAIYCDKKGKLQEQVVSFYEAVARVNADLPIIDKKYNNHLGWNFMFTMKQNEMFVFPNKDFEFETIDFLDEKNCTLISKHLFRIQKIANKDYTFRHHLETEVIDKKELKQIAWRREGINGIENIIKVRINHIGKIVHLGEY